MTQILLSPFSWLLTFFYNLVGSYGVALILFACVVKVILFPFSLKGKKSMIQMNMLQGKLSKLQKQYGKDRERYNVAVQELYAKEKVNPMGGCLWSLLPLCILLPLYAIIRQPLKYMMGLDEVAIANVANAVDWNTLAMSNGWIKEIADTFANSGYNQLYLASLITPENLSAAQMAAGEAGASIFAINFDFLGLVNLAIVPQLKFWTITGGFALFLLPVISACTGFFFSRITMKTNAMNQQGNENSTANQTGKMMMWMSPLMSLWIGFAMPAGLCLYWISNNLLSVIQETICGKILKKDYERAAAAREEQARLDKEEEKNRKRELAEERARRAEEEKLNRGKKKIAQQKQKEDEHKIPQCVKDASRVGMRQYARGRAYDPNRYATKAEETVEDVAEEQTPLALEESAVLAPPVEAVEHTEEGALEGAYAPEAEAESAQEENN